MHPIKTVCAPVYATMPGQRSASGRLGRSQQVNDQVPPITAD